MPDCDTIREEQVQKAVQLLKDKPEAEREAFIEVLALTPEEKEEVRRRLWAPPLPPEPEKLRKEIRKLRETETFQRLVQDVRRGKAVLFLGAGVSQDVGMPSSAALIDALKALAKNYRVSLEKEDLPVIAGLLERAGLRRDVIATLKSRFDEAASPQVIIPPHRKGCYRLIPYLGEDLNKMILTTNWDDLLEKAFREAGESVIAIRRDRELPLVAAAVHAVVKLHGDFTDPDTLIVSDNDYALARHAILQPGGLASSLWGMMSALLSQYSCIFAGYRLADEDVKLIQSLITARQIRDKTRNYMVGPFDEREQKGIRDWLEMEVIPTTASQFFVALAQELAEFANRRDDLNRIFRLEAAPFLEFYAPFGAGKHALLDEVERRARDKGWADEQIIRIDLRPGPRPLTGAGLTERMAKAIGKSRIQQGEQLALALREKKRLLILFEHTEAMESGWEEFTTFVSGVVAPVVRELDEKGQHSKLILAGRYPVEGWPFTSFKRYAEVFPLSPFILKDVREMVGKYTLFHDPQAAVAPPSQQLVKQIYELTGRSHPGFIKQILDDLMKKSEKPDGRLELPPALTEQEINNYLVSFLEIIHKEVWTTVPPEIGDLFAEGLCVLRRLNAGLLARLAQEDAFYDLFKTVGKPEDVVNWLKKCHLLTYEYLLEVTDPIIRRIHSYALQRKDQMCFTAAHSAAASAWKDLLPFAEDLTQLRYFREWLYHQASYLQLDGKTEESHWKVLCEEVKAIPFRTSQPYPARMGETLLKDIEEKKERDKERDEELYEALLASLGEAYYEDFRQLLIANPETTR